MTLRQQYDSLEWIEDDKPRLRRVRTVLGEMWVCYTPTCRASGHLPRIAYAAWESGEDDYRMMMGPRGDNP